MCGGSAQPRLRRSYARRGRGGRSGAGVDVREEAGAPSSSFSVGARTVPGWSCSVFGGLAKAGASAEAVAEVWVEGLEREGSALVRLRPAVMVARSLSGSERLASGLVERGVSVEFRDGRRKV